MKRLSVLLLVLVSATQAGVATLGSDADTYLRDGRGPFGGGTYMWAASTGFDFVGYLRFDLSAYTATDISAATLTLQTYGEKVHDSIVSGRFAVYGLANVAGNTAQNWDESALTSGNAGDEWDLDSLFATSLGEGRVINLDADQGANVTEVVPNASSGTCTLSGADLVSFLQARANDDGLATFIITMKDSAVKYTGYGTKEADAAYQPALSLTVPEPATMILLGLGSLLAVRRKRG